MEKILTKDWSELKTLTLEVWEHGLMGVDIGKIIIALLIFMGFLLIRGIFSRYVLSRLHAWSAKSTTKLDDKIVDALIPPIRFIPIILGIFFAGQYLELDDNLQAMLMKIERSMIAFTIFWAMHRVLEPLSHGLKKLEKILTRPMMTWIFKAMRIIVVFIGGAVILEIWGIAVGPLLAGLGLFGAAVALGAQDLFKNLIGGITILAEKRFHPGEWILVDGVVEGIVEDIGFRSTKVRRFDKAPVHVPNSQLSDAAVTNFSRMTNRRIKWAIGVEYRTSVEQLQQIRDKILEYIMNEDAFSKAEHTPVIVRVESFGASSIDFLLWCYTCTTVWAEFLQAQEALALRVKEIIEDEVGTAFAFPSQSIYVESLPGEATEVFIPPKG